MVIATAFAGIMLTAQTVTAAPGNNVEARGMVLDYQHNALQGATVTLKHHTTIIETTPTDENGRFSFSGLSYDTSYIISASYNGHDSGETTIYPDDAVGGILEDQDLWIDLPIGASFIADTTEGEAPLEVEFTSTSTGTITRFDWDFGDGTGSDEENPSHIFSEVGSYEVTLTVARNEDEDTSEVMIIKVNEAATPSPSASPSPSVTPTPATPTGIPPQGWPLTIDMSAFYARAASESPTPTPTPTPVPTIVPTETATSNPAIVATAAPAATIAAIVTPTPKATTTPATSLDNNCCWWLGLLLLLIIIVVIVYYYLKSRQGKEKQK